MPDVVVIGAGLAGLSAARRLVTAGRDVVVVEARDRVGGRTWTVQVDGVTIDAGGQWVGPGQPRMYALLRELGLETFPTPTGGATVLDHDGRIRTYEGTIPPVGPLHLVQLQLALTWIDRTWQRVQRLGIDHPSFRGFDSLTVDAWLRRRLPGELVHDLLRPAVRTVFGAETDELTVLHFLAYLASSGGFMRLVDVVGGFQQDRIAGGAQPVSERLADRVGRERIVLDSPVRRIRQDADGVTVEADRGTWTARKVIVTAPPPVVRRIDFSPRLPMDRTWLQERSAMGATVKFFAFYDRPFWKDKGLSGEGVCTAGPISVCFDNTSPTSPPMLLAFVTGEPARAWADRDPAERRAAILDKLAAWFGPEARTPRATHEVDWSVQPWSEGCPITLFPSGTLSRFGDALRRPFGRIHWAGTESARVCMGFMEGAVESGERAADEVLG